MARSKPKYDKTCDKWYWECGGFGIPRYSHVVTNDIWKILSPHKGYIYLFHNHSLRKYYSVKAEAIRDYSKAKNSQRRQ